MNPATASMVFRELLQTTDNELGMFARRAGLQSSFSAEDLLKARELLEALGEAFDTGSHRDWEAVRAAFAGLRTKRNPYLMGGAVGVVAHAPSSSEPQPPPLVNRVVVPKPSLGDAAPGTAEHAERSKARFVPGARRRGAVDPTGLPADGAAGMPSLPLAAPPSPSGYPAPGSQALPIGHGGPDPRLAAQPAAAGAAAYPPVVASPWTGSEPPGPEGAEFAAPSPWAGEPPAAGRPWPSGQAVGVRAPAPVDDWHKPLPAPPQFLAPVGGSSREAPGAGAFTRAQPVAQAQPLGATSVPPQPSALPASAPPVAAPPVAAPPVAARPAPAPPPPPRRAGGAVAIPAEAGAVSATADGRLDAGSVYESVARYASFCAACAEFPDRIGQTLAGYGLADASERGALDERWQDRFDDDPELLSRWEQLFGGFRKSLRGSR